MLFDTDTQSFQDMMLMADEMATEFNIPKDDLLTGLLQISFHETGGSYDHKQIQDKGKPGQEGMGLFQFEYGKGQGGHTAINRLINYNDKIGNNPSYLQNIPIAKGIKSNPDYRYYSGKDGFDATSFSPSEQYMLMMQDLTQDLRKDEVTDISNIPFEDLWINYHAIPDTSDVQDRRDVYQENMKVFNVQKTRDILDQLLNYNP